MPLPADRLLAAQQFPALNRQFYRADPADYLSTRLHLLAIAGARPELVVDTLRQGLQFGSLELRSSHEDSWEDEEVERFTVTETVVLLHHATEACLRLFFAHEFDSECPWLETARMKRPSQFKERLAEFVDTAHDAAQLERIAKWTLGRTVQQLQAEQGEPGKAGADALSGSRDLLVMSASRLLSEGAMYNAAKHGLAVLPQKRGVKAVFQHSDIDLSVDGPSLSYLETRETKPGERHTWHETTTWINRDSWVAWTYLVLRQIRNIWSMGKLIHTGEEGTVYPIFPHQVEGIMTLDAKTYNIESMSSQLAYYVEDPPAPRTQ